MSLNHKKKRDEIHKTHPYIQFKKGACEKCGIPQRAGKIYDKDGFFVRKLRGANDLTVHHIDQNPYNNAPENLKTLCRKCHDEIHNS